MEQKQDYSEVCTTENISDTTSSINSNTNVNYCAICIETEEANDRYIKFPCQHIFHVKCFESFLDYNILHQPRKENIDCPICRETFSTNTLKQVFNVCHHNPNQDITVYIQNEVNEQNVARVRSCTKADIIAIIVLSIAITIFLTILYNT